MIFIKKLCFILVLVLLLTGCGTDSSGNAQGEARWVSLDIYAINDLHGRLADTDEQSGLDELSTYLEQKENSILLATGDMWQGTSESNLTGGFIITEWMNRMDFDAMTVGSHEFDWGEEQLQQNIQLAQFPFLGINIYSENIFARDLLADYIAAGGLSESSR